MKRKFRLNRNRVVALFLASILVSLTVGVYVGQSSFSGSLENLPWSAGAPSTYSYTIDSNATHYFAFNTTGFLKFSGTNKATVINSCVGKLTSGGTIFLKNMLLPNSGITLTAGVTIIEEYEGKLTFFKYPNTDRHYAITVPYSGFWHEDFEWGNLTAIETQIAGAGSGSVAVTSSITWSGLYALNCSATSAAGGQKARAALGLSNPIPLFTTSAKYGVTQPFYMGGWCYISDWNTSLDLGIMDFRCVLDQHPYGSDTNSWVAWVHFGTGGNTVVFRISYPRDDMDDSYRFFTYNTAALIGSWHFFELGAYINAEGWVKFWIDNTLVGEAHLDNSHTIEAHPHHSYQVEDCEDAWTPKTHVACGTDNSDYKEGSNSATMTINSTFTTGLIATEDFTALELSGYRNYEFWLKSNVTLDAGDLQFVYDESAACASPLESLDLPYIPADTWVKIKIPKVSIIGDDLPVFDAIVSVGLNATRDFGVALIKIDDVEATELTPHIDKLYMGISPIASGTSYTEVIIDDWFISETFVTSI